MAVAEAELLVVVEEQVDQAGTQWLPAVPPATLEARMAELAAEHRALWRKGAAEPGAAAALCRLAIDRLEALALVRRCGDGVIALPALARFAYAEPTVGGGRAESGEPRRGAPVDRGGPV